MCGGDAPPWAHGIHDRRYDWCPTCGSIQIAADLLPTPETERNRYLEHNNQPDNSNYREYLTRFLESAIATTVSPPARILDFGSGPSPVLSMLLAERGYDVWSYDPIFQPNTTRVFPRLSQLQASTTSGSSDASTRHHHVTSRADHDGPPNGMYDAVVALEVVEHLHAPGAELAALLRLLTPGGSLILRTGVFDARTPGVDTDAADRFLAWWYRRDVTHVWFLTPSTIRWIQKRYSLRLTHRAKGEELVFITSRR